MKRAIAWILAAALLLCGCQAETEADPEDYAQPVAFYYCTPLGEISGAAIAAEIRDLGERELTLREILKLYLRGPVSDGLRSPFPEGMALEALSLEDGILYLTFNEDYAALSGVSLTRANACLVHTLSQFPAVEGVRLQTTGSMLTEQLTQVLTAADYVLEDQTAVGDLMTLRLYYLQEKGDGLVETVQERAFETDEEVPAYLVQQLIQGAQDKDFLSPLPEETALLSIRVSEGVCTVEFSEGFLQNKAEDPERNRLTILAIVETLTQLPQIQSVRILCDGAVITSGYAMDLTVPLEHDEAALAEALEKAE